MTLKKVRPASFARDAGKRAGNDRAGQQINSQTTPSPDVSQQIYAYALSADCVVVAFYRSEVRNG